MLTFRSTDRLSSLYRTSDGVMSENYRGGRAAREHRTPRAVRELERAHSQAGMPTSLSISGAGSAARVRRSHSGSPAAAAKTTSITFSRLPSRTQLAARRLRRW